MNSQQLSISAATPWHTDNGEAEWVGKAPGGDMIQLEWDSLGLLKKVSDAVGGNTTWHDFTYAPSGLRIRDKRSTAIAGSMPHDKRFAYTTTGTLLSVWEAAASSQHGDGFTMASRPRKTDIVYANGEAVMEIATRPPAAQGGPHDDSLYMPIPPPPPENIYELHNDYLGSPRYITHASKPPSLLPRGEMAGEQAFGPYGERMEGSFVVGGTPDDPILKGLPSGYKPITGYTGHVAEDMTGLIYMRGRYYSPAWHRFVNSDQGVDPLSVNQFAYVGGMPLVATDPTGMMMGRVHAEMSALQEILLGEYLFFLSPAYTKELAPEALADEREKKEWREASEKINPGKDIDKAACKAYFELAAKNDGIPTGRTEAGARLFVNRKNSEVVNSRFVKHTVPEGASPALLGLNQIMPPPGHAQAGFIHTHPYGRRPSEADIDYLNNSYYSNSSDLGYMTSPGLWKSHQIVRFDRHGNEKTIDCNKFVK